MFWRKWGPSSRFDAAASAAGHEVVIAHVGYYLDTQQTKSRTNPNLKLDPGEPISQENYNPVSPPIRSWYMLDVRGMTLFAS
jgi:hypothetical protein